MKICAKYRNRFWGIAVMITSIMILSLSSGCGVHEKIETYEDEYWAFRRNPSAFEYYVEAYENESYKIWYAVLDDDTCIAVSSEGELPECFYFPEKTQREHSIKIIWERAFANHCNNMKKLFLPDTVVRVETNAFACAGALEYAYIGNSVYTIEGSTFSGAGNLSQIECHDNPFYTTPAQAYLLNSEGEIIIGTNSGLVESEIIFSIGDEAYEKRRLECLEIPTGVTEIGAYAYFNCFMENTELVIPQTVESIGKYAFSATNITTVSGGAYQTIDEFMFYGCTKLKGLMIPDTVKEIKGGAFLQVYALNELFIPETVERIDSNAFYAPDLTVYCEAESKPEEWADNWAANVKEVIWGYPHS